jgi:methyl-accepting chemotaxis protein
MKIRSRISIIFSILTSLVLIVFGATIYLLESYHQTVDFQNRLKDRIEITENFFLEKENFSETEFVKIRKQFLHTLPDETVEVIKLKDNTVPNFKLKNLKPIEDQVLSLNSYSFELKKIQGESKQFRVKGESYLIIVTAIDTIGKENLSFLLVSIMLIILLAIPLIFTISFIITRRALLPLSKKIEHANNISAANLSQRLKVINSNDEIGQLATAFNKLLDRLEVSFDAQKSFISNA